MLGDKSFFLSTLKSLMENSGNPRGITQAYCLSLSPLSISVSSRKEKRLFFLSLYRYAYPRKDSIIKKMHGYIYVLRVHIRLCFCLLRNHCKKSLTIIYYCMANNNKPHHYMTFNYNAKAEAC